MNKISQRLTTLFKDYRIIIWYDENGGLKDEFDKLDIGVEKLQIQGNEFGIKYKILYEQKEDKFLVYSDQKEPPKEENWLLDIGFNFYKFSADKISLIAQELDFGVDKKEFVKRYEKFFSVEKNAQKFKMIVSKDDHEEAMILKICAIVMGGDETLNDVILTLLSKKDSYEKLEKYNLQSAFWDVVKKAFSYSAKNPSLDEFTYKLFKNHFFAYVDKSKCELNKEAKLFMKTWMDSSTYKSLFETVSKRVESELKIKSLLDGCTFKNIVECDTFEVCERFVITNLKDRILNNEIDVKELEEIINKREYKFWHGSYKNIYQTFRYALLLLENISHDDFKISSFEDGIEKYTKSWYKIDYFYRNFIYYRNRAEHSEVVSALTKVEDAYLNSFLRVLNDNWQTFVKEYSVNLKNHQRGFYSSKIVPFVEKKQKIFVIISDALRYECGSQLAKILSYENTEKRSFGVKQEYLISSLPSYTQLGMASLLPHEKLKIKDKNDSVFVDGKTSQGLEARKKILQAKYPKSSAISDEDFLAFNKSDGREFAKAHDIVYIYHDEIDSTGDDAKSEEKVFDAIKLSFESIKKIVKQIVNLNYSNIFITADHGFIYTNEPTNESEFCKFDAQLQKTMKINRRFIIGKNLEPTSCVEKFTSKDLGIEGDNEFLLAKSINKIRKQGGGHRFVHGGATLQELIIPLLEVKYIRKNIVKNVGISITPISSITTNNLHVSLYQDEPISENVKPATFAVGFYAKDGTLLSEEYEIKLESKDKENRNREIRLNFNLKEVAKQYNNEFITFLAKDISKSKDLPADAKMDIKLQLSFFNDFDEF